MSVKDTRSRYHALFEAAHDAIFTMREDKFLDCNPRTLEIFGCSREQIVTKTPFDFSPAVQPDGEGSYAKGMAKIRSAMAGEPQSFEWTHTRLDGTPFEAEVSLSAFDDDGERLLIAVVRDVSERRRAEEALHESEVRYRAVFENAPIGVVLSDLKGTLVAANNTFQEIVGYPAEELPGMGFRDFTHPDDLEHELELAKASLGSGTSGFHIEKRYLRRDGETRHVELRVTTVTARDGEPQFLFGLVEDITERRRAEELDRARAGLVAYSFEHTLPELLRAFLDEAEQLTDSEIGFFHFFEEDQDTISLQTWSSRTQAEMCTAEGAGAHYPISEAGVWIDAVRERRPVVHNDYASLLHKKGLPEGHAPIVRELVVPVLRGEKILAVLGVGNKSTEYTEADVDLVQQLADLAWETVERKRAELALRESEERYRLLVENAPTVIWRSDQDGHTSYVSANVEEIYGFSADEIYEMGPEAWFGRIHPDDVDGVQAGFEALIERGEKFDVEYRVRHKNGEWIWLRDSADAVRDEKDKKHVFGAFSDITARKQVELELREALEKVSDLQEQLAAENVMLRAEVRRATTHGDIVGNSEPIREVLRLAEQVAAVDSAVLLLGETGTGKEVLARAIHDWSARKDRPLITVNCAAIPAPLLESELFGREKGAYTGALSRQAGRFEAADRSTLFLDEVGELPLELQAKLLRVLQDGKFERLGSTETREADVRIVAATNRDLEAEVAAGRFREDLFFRLDVFPITVPPLRERREDVPDLVWHFVREIGANMGKNIEEISQASMTALERHSWPGNVRELRNVIERAMIQADGAVLKIRIPQSRSRESEAPLSLDDVQRRHIVEVLELTGWKIRGEDGAAATLDLKPTTLESRIRKLGIKRPAK